MAALAGHASRLSEPIWFEILTQIPGRSVWEDSLQTDTAIVAIWRFGLANRRCQQIVQQGPVAIMVQRCFEKRREHHNSQRVDQRCRDHRILQFAWDGDIAGVQEELSNGASLESGAKQWASVNDTPLSMACSQGHIALVQMLLSRQANIHHRVYHYKPYTPLSIAFKLGHLECGRAVRAAVRIEEEEKAKAKREAALRIFQAATDEVTLKTEQEALVGRWRNPIAAFSLDAKEGALKELVYRDFTEPALVATLSKRCDGWWQGTPRGTPNLDGKRCCSIRIKLSQGVNRGEKVVRRVREPVSSCDLSTFGCTVRDRWGPVARCSKVASSMSDEEVAELMRLEVAWREARREAQREMLRKRRAVQFDADLSDFGESELEDELSDDSLEDFQHEPACEDETQEEEEDPLIHSAGGHAALLSDAAEHFRKGQGGAVDLACSFSVCSMALSLEKDSPAQECSPENSTFGRAMKLLRALASLGVREAVEALPYFHVIDEEKSQEREQLRVEAEAKRKAMEEERRKKIDDCQSLKRQEIERCRLFQGSPISTGVCTNKRYHNSDFCTYKHGEVKELPPHCLHFARGDCRNGDGCWFNHMRCICGFCKR